MNVQLPLPEQLVIRRIRKNEIVCLIDVRILRLAANTTIYEITRIPEKIMLLKTTELGNGYLNIMLMDIFISA